MEENTTLKDLVLETLAELGFVVELQDDGVYAFNTGVARMAYEENDDERFLRFTMPYVIYRDDQPADVIDEMVQKANENLKYVKVYKVDGSLFIFYERKLYEWEHEHMEDILVDVIEGMSHAKMYVHRLLEKKKEDSDNADAA